MGMEAETLEYLEYLPQDHHHPRVSRGQHLKSLRSEGGGKYCKIKDERRKTRASRIKELSFTVVAEGLRDVTDIIYLPRIHGDLFGAVIDEVEFSAFVQGTSKLSFPLCRIRFVNSLLELSGLHSPCLGEYLDQMKGSVSHSYFNFYLCTVCTHFKKIKIKPVFFIY